MDYSWVSVSYFIAFLIISVAASSLAKYITKIKLPLISGFLAVGILAGPYFLSMIPKEAALHLNFLNEMSLAVIAFAAGTELYLKELKNSFRSILINTFSQMLFILGLSTVALYMASDFIPFLVDLPSTSKFAISLLTASIFTASSPSSNIAIINELRAKGPYVRMAMGVTVVKDVLVIVLFALTFSLAQSIIIGVEFNLILLVDLVVEIGGSIGLGLLLGKAIEKLCYFNLNSTQKSIIIVLMGYSIYLISHFIKHYSANHFYFECHIEPLLVCIIGAFYMTNYTLYRLEFSELIHNVSPYFYIVFFTLTGITLSIETIIAVWSVAFIFFGIRLVALYISVNVGGILAKDPPSFRKFGWMPFITQAGVSIGLSANIAIAFPDWGPQLATLIIASIVLTQLMGPPLFKYSLIALGEAHNKKEKKTYDNIKNALIFGIENQSVALARSLQKHHWAVTIAACRHWKELDDVTDVKIEEWNGITEAELIRFDASSAEAIVLLLSDEENYALAELIYEKIGTQNVIVRLQDRENIDKFLELGVEVVEPTTAIINLLDHYVRSPVATSMMLSDSDEQDTMDVELLAPVLFDVAIRDLMFPSEILVLAVKRKGDTIISHGYTRLQKNDIITLFGPLESLEKVAMKFEKD